MHSAYTFSTNVSLIDTCESLGDSDIIFICGHGNVRKQTIGGKSPEQIASLLERLQYSGQPVYISACGSNVQSKRHLLDTDTISICEELDYLLNKLLGNCIWTAEDLVFSDAEGYTITIRQDKSEGALEIYILEPKEERSAMKYQKSIKDQLPEELTLDTSSPQDVLKKLTTYHNSNYDNIQAFKQSIITHTKDRRRLLNSLLKIK